LGPQFFLGDWCIEGISIITFETDTEYRVLQCILSSLDNSKVALVHSKGISFELNDEIILVDATGHALTAKTALRRRISDSDDERYIENPADIQGFLSRLRKLKQSHKEIKWWLWWSPSDLIAHGLDEDEIVQTLRVISSDFSDIHFMAFIAKEVHSKRGLALFEYVSNVSMSVERIREPDMNDLFWRTCKHPDVIKEGKLLGY